MEIGSLLSLSGDVLDIFGGLVSAKAQAKAYEYNALVSSQNAEQATNEAFENERRTRIEGFKQIEDMKTGYAASGIASGGSAFDAIYNSVVNAELDALTVRTEGLSRAQAFRQQATMDTYAARNTRIAGNIEALGKSAKALGSFAGKQAGTGA